MANIFIKPKFQENFTATYDEESGISRVTFNNKYGKFVGEARRNPEDASSKFRGCYIAEHRANIQYYKTAIRFTRERINTIDSIIKDKDMVFLLRGILQNEIARLEELQIALAAEKNSLDLYIANLDKTKEERMTAAGFGQN